jgi:phospholipid/cholesterol/gamma-HCH transport system ATP-binding protein
MTPLPQKAPPVLEVRDLTLAYGDTVIQRNLDFAVAEGDIFMIMGGSGCGKSTLLRHLLGLQRPAAGRIFYGDQDFWELDAKERGQLLRNCGVLYQSGALWSSMTLEENVAFPLRIYTNLPERAIGERVSFKLALVGLAGFERHYPAELSGGMRKRAGLARAMALDPNILFFDEPSAGLDPVSASRLDELILELRESLGTTLVVVSHDLASIFAIGTDGIFLDGESRTMIAAGDPHRMLEESEDPRVRQFLTRGRA